MSRLDHVVLRRQESARRARVIRRDAARGRNGRDVGARQAVVDPTTGRGKTTEPKHVQGHPWWRERFASMVDRRVRRVRGRWVYSPAAKREGSPAPARPAPPTMIERPAEMTRQTARRLFRAACKLSGVPWRAEQ